MEAGRCPHCQSEAVVKDAKSQYWQGTVARSAKDQYRQRSAALCGSGWLPTVAANVERTRKGGGGPWARPAGGPKPGLKE